MIIYTQVPIHVETKKNNDLFVEQGTFGCNNNNKYCRHLRLTCFFANSRARSLRDEFRPNLPYHDRARLLRGFTNELSRLASLYRNNRR